MIEIIPAIDIIDGQCVRLTQGDYHQKTTYFSDPLEVALRYEQAGIHRLHMVDLDGAKASQPLNLGVLERIASRTKLDIQYGGGIKSEGALKNVRAAGANRVICGSIAVARPELFEAWLSVYGPEHLILGADTRNGKIAVNGWLEEAQTEVRELIARFLEAGLSQVICTDISKDGMLQGPSFELYTGLQREFPQVEVTVSGGISGMEDIRQLNRMGLRSVIVGKAIYEGKITMEDLSRWLQNE